MKNILNGMASVRTLLENQEAKLKLIEREFLKLNNDNISYEETQKTLDKIFKLLLSNLHFFEKSLMVWRRILVEFTSICNVKIESNKESVSLIDDSLDALEIKAGFTKEGWVYVKSPSFLPEQRMVFLSGAIFEPLNIKLRVLSGNRVVYNEPCVICVIQNVSNRALVIRDNDNVELLNLTNYLAKSFLVDDGARYCSFFYSACFTDENYVEAFVVPLREFDEFYKKLMTGSLTPKDIYEKYPKK